MPSFKRPIGASGAAVALALVAAACGSGGGDLSTSTGAGGTPATEAPAASEPAEAAGPQPASDGEAEAAGPDVATSHLFPDLQTVNIADGSTFNLADELAGGDTPVLLWFWAPH